jgi:hypothetical protein
MPNIGGWLDSLFGRRWPEAATAVFTFGLALGTFLLFWATRTLVKGAEGTAKRQLRAYINIEGAIMMDWTSPDPMVRVVFKNFGDTPAYDVTYKFEVKGDMIPLGAELTLSSSAISAAAGVIGPSGPLTITQALAPITQIREFIAKGNRGIYAFGKIDYTDAFKASRWTKFCFLYDPNIINSRDGTMAICEYGNDAS